MKKIVIFAPHPDDELIGAGGSILKWKDEGHDIHIIYITDGRAAYTYERKMGRLDESKELSKISEYELAEIRMKEINDVIEILNIPKEHIHKFKFPDQNAKNFIREGMELSKNIIKDADRIVLPSNNNSHEDHQATYEIAVGAAKELNLKEAEFYGYALYVAHKEPREKKVKINIKNYRDKVFEAFSKYKSQLVLSLVKMYYETIKRKRIEFFGKYSLSDIGKYYNF
ncbi:MAG: PIG-L deacetylase family protein [Promethearchaeota archaeon]